jgi:hypothetical protein
LDDPLDNLALLAAWHHRQEPLSADLRSRLAKRLAQACRFDPNPEVRSIGDSLLQGWGAELRAEIQRELIDEGRSPARAWFVNALGETMIVLDPKSFHLPGSPPPGEALNPFAISATEATFDRFHALVPQHKQDDPGSGAQGDVPAVAFRLVHIAAFCNALSQRDGIPENEWCYPAPPELSDVNCDPLPGYRDRRGYRLPTEEEWEFACRAGSATSHFVGEDAELLGFYAWDKVQSNMVPQPVGRLLPNAFGLFDTLGNVSELCLAGEGILDGKRKAMYRRRGQSCLARLEAMSSLSVSEYSVAGALSNSLGFRVVCTMAREDLPTGSRD